MADKTRFPWIAEAEKWLRESNSTNAAALKRITEDAPRTTPPDAKVSPPLVAKTNSRPRRKAINQRETIREEIANGFASGESFAEFNKRVESTVDATKDELETAFRTATHQAYIHAATQTYEKPSVKRQFPYILYHSAHDTRTRPAHRVLDGLLFEIGSPAYDIARRALAAPNCRCRIIAQTPRKAAEAKLKPVTLEELPALVLALYGKGNPEHVKLVKRGAKAVNEWRLQNPDVRLNLIGANFSGLDLSGVSLHEAILCRANLCGTKLQDVDFGGAFLVRAKLTGANLEESNLSDADLSEATLTGANLIDVELSRAKICGAKIIGADLSGANLSDANLTYAEVGEDKVIHTTFRNANLTNANLSRANLWGANLTNANLSNADLTGAELTNTNLKNTNLTGAILSKTE